MVLNVILTHLFISVLKLIFGNDIIILAKHLCMIMMEMTDFTRGKELLQTTMAVIEAAKKIFEAGTKLDALARQIADQCPESSTKKIS